MRSGWRELLARLEETRAAALRLYDLHEQCHAPAPEALVIVDKALMLAMERADEKLAWLTDYGQR